MSKIYFRYGTMRSGKSQDAIRAYDSYIKSDRYAIIAKPDIDTRSSNLVVTRKGYNEEAVILHDENYEIINLVVDSDKKVEAIIIDEAQFLSQRQIQELIFICDDLGIPSLCYGLKTDSNGKLFEGSKLLLELADNIEEIKTVCQFCNKKATMNLRTVTNNGVKIPVINEEVIKIGDDEYIQTCRKCYMNIIETGIIS